MSDTAFVESLVLAQANLEPARRRRAGLEVLDPPTDAAGLPSNLQAAVDVGSLVSFVDGVGRAQKEDVLATMQLAQRGASGKYDRFTNVESWYSLYVEILERVGWVVEQFAFVRHDENEGELRMDKAALAIIAAVATGNQLTVLTESIKALGALADNDGTIRLFDFHSVVNASGNFQIGAVQRSANDALSLALGAFHFNSNDMRRRFLFFAWGAHQVEFWTSAQKLTFNESFYAERREVVRKKLGVDADAFLGALRLG